jgi:hypothetical protein
LLFLVNTGKLLGEFRKNKSSSTSDVAQIILAQYIIRSGTLRFKAKRGALAAPLGEVGGAFTAPITKIHVLFFVLLYL